MKQLLDVPVKYWLDEEGLTRNLTKELKREIDIYILNQVKKKNEESSYEVQYKTIVEMNGRLNEIEMKETIYPYEEEIWARRINIVKDAINDTVIDCIFGAEANTDEDVFFYRAKLLLLLLTEVKRIGIENLKEYIEILKKYESKQGLVMNKKEYELLFGKYVCRQEYT